MKTLLRIEEMMPYLPTAVKDTVSRVAKDSGQAVDKMELHRHAHSEKSKVNGLDPKSRQSLKYVSVRTQDRDDEIVLPEGIQLKEFMKYGSVLVNHNYSLLPVGSDESISADDWGIKALTNHAETGPGTLADTVWILVRDGHLKASSIGFVPTSFTKPGSRDWDHVANQLQSNWAEFSKEKAEKSISRIITGGVLLEHSFVSVPCNADAELISVCKGMNLDGKVVKQLGWEMKDGILVNKAEAEPEPCVCDECGFVKDAVPGSKCPECKTGDMKPKSKEKAITVISKGMGTLNADELRQALNKIISPQSGPGESVIGAGYVSDIYEDHFIYQKNDEMFSQGYATVGSKPQLVGDPVKVERRTAYVPMAGNENKGFHSHAVEKPNPHMPGGSFTECVLIMTKKGHDEESAKRICGALQAESGEKLYDVLAEEIVKKGGPGSGNFGHEGRPGEVGGSGGGGSREEYDRTALRAKNSSNGADTLTAADNFSEEERKLEQTTRRLAANGMQVLSRPEAESLGREAADQLNGTGIFEGSVYQSHFSGFKIENGEPVGVVYAGVGVGSGESDSSLRAGADRLNEAGWNATVVSNDYYRGIVVSVRGKSPTIDTSTKIATKIKVIRPAPSVKILFAPPTGDMIAAQVGEAVERALSRRTGKIL